MKKITCFLLLISSTTTFAQKINKVINAKEVERVEKILSADDMQGRAVFTPGIDKAADFISSEFKKTGLKTFSGANDYRQSFFMLKPTQQSLSATADGQNLADKNVIVITTKEDLSVSNTSGFEQVAIKPGDNFFGKAYEYISSQKNYVVTIDTSFAKIFPRLQYFKQQVNPTKSSIVFILAATTPS